VEERLEPLNVLLSLATLRADLNRARFASAGFRVAGLEVPVAGPRGGVTVDVILLHEESSHLVLCEVKSGANLDEGQAFRYGGLDPASIVQAGHVTLPRREPPTVETLYVCLAENVSRIILGMQAAGVSYPVMAIQATKVVLENSTGASALLCSIFEAGPIRLDAPPVRFVPFDHDSAVEIVRPFVKAELVAALASRTNQITVPGLTERVAPLYGLYGRKVAGVLCRKVGEAVRDLAAAEPTIFAYDPPTRTRPDGLVRLLRTPEEYDTRGRTQAYQALARGGRPRRRRQLADPDQTDLLQELDQAHDVDDEGDRPGDEEDVP